MLLCFINDVTCLKAMLCWFPGITSNGRSAKHLTYDVLKKMVLEQGDGNPKSFVTLTEPWKLGRDPIKGRMYARPLSKSWSVVYSKRRLVRDENGFLTKSVPFGTKD